ncbi:family 43 glycosylhydrolase [Maribellus sediminis]|uniref:family 43 glycosylhydrolase n=1 Tax=Maribellus sediminis TaxID=2696285 RepID=UPI0014301A60|nr:family 43 glycosylhydrolase [Maribellus sediminis]
MRLLSREIKLCSVLVFLFLFSLKVLAQPPAHDPSKIMRDGDRYWTFKTELGIGAISASNNDFSDWQSEPSVFGDTWPSWINTYVPDFAGHFWAPACIFLNGKYYLYYSCSTMGSHVSAIGLATSPSLNNPDWTDQGMVVYSDGNNTATVSNAIDPAIFKDDDGKAWMTYGSWFGGISIVELDTLTGKTVGEKTTLVGGNHQDIEASFLLKHDDYYYLFVNRGLCCRGVESTYYIQVGRASSVTGPYDGWRTFLQTNGRYIGPGHIGYNEGRLTYHVYDRDDDGTAKMMNTTLDWSDGWPVAVEVTQDPPGELLPDGTYRIQSFDSTKIVGVANNSPYEGANVEILDFSDDNINGTSWVINNVNLHQYQIAPKNYINLGLDVYNCVGDDDANIGLWSYWGGQCQKWIFVDMGNKNYQIRSALSNKPIQVNGTFESGTNIVQMSNNSNDTTQLFTLVLLELEDTTYNQYPQVVSYSSQQSGNPASNIIDGNNSDGYRWSAENFPQYVVIDYGDTLSISGTKIWTYQNRAYQYTVEFDTDIDFSDPYIVDRRTNTSAGQPITDNFEPVAARYARLTVTGAYDYTGPWVSITEFEIIEEEIVGADELTLNDNTKIYPNPVVDVLNIQLPAELSSGADLAIYNMMGQLVFRKTGLKGNIELMNLSNLKKGIYSLIITNNKTFVTKRFVKY